MSIFRAYREGQRKLALFGGLAALSVLTLLATRPAPLYANPLDEIKATQEYQDLLDDLDKIRRKKGYRKRYKFSRKSEYGRLFGNSKHSKLIIEWMTPATFPYKFEKVQTYKDGKTIIATTKFEKTETLPEPIDINVYIPHPVQFQNIDLELETLYRDLDYKEYDYTHREKLKLKNHHSLPFELFQMADKSCVVQVKLARKAIATLTASSCDYRKFLIAITEELQWSRLNTRLKIG